MNFRVSYKGINVQVTNRDTTISLQPFFSKAKTAIDWALENGFQPEIQKSFPKKEVKLVLGKTCPKCGSGIVEKRKKDGSLYFKCEKGGWNQATNQPTGCDYVDWNNPAPPQLEENWGYV